VCANQYIGVIKEEVGLLNKKHFDFELNNVSLKYNKSNWGSCSSKKNINLSSRLLLVPKKVREYIIIHELAHLKEMNHSKRFWDLVESACADFKIYEKWLNEYGPTIDY